MKVTSNSKDIKIREPNEDREVSDVTMDCVDQQEEGEKEVYVHVRACVCVCVNKLHIYLPTHSTFHQFCELFQCVDHLPRKVKLEKRSTHYSTS